ncbi:Hypothetical protein, putative [Bodo saltans]|uniref:Uncharacterized protein n=1 Tax=Bodo saltans TaxID=75058 RepID=A0A0S4IP74_BODSA|nr:Hypothetical protein, putative [Bodo saltans]|eukprot:CUE98897.1 Hypothetical protein, putative [Bodo saltans]
MRSPCSVFMLRSSWWAKWGTRETIHICETKRALRWHEKDWESKKKKPDRSTSCALSLSLATARNVRLTSMG